MRYRVRTMNKHYEIIKERRFDIAHEALVAYEETTISTKNPRVELMRDTTVLRYRIVQVHEEVLLK